MLQSKGSVYYKLMSHKQSQKGQVHLEKVVTTDSAHPDCSQRFAIFFFAVFRSASCIFFPLYEKQSWPAVKKNILVSELDQFQCL